MRKKASIEKELDEKPDVARLERQMERGSLFMHTALSNNSDRINEVESVLYGLVDSMVKGCKITAEEVFQASDQVRQEMEAKGENIGPGVALRVDGETETESFVPVNCAERIHICKAVCCHLNFALSAPEIEAGKVKWDLGRPYFIRQEANGCCTHKDPNKHSCRVYSDRPAVCQKYSCAGDKRIWKDFEGMELNEEWISENFGTSRPHLARALMVRADDRE